MKKNTIIDNELKYIDDEVFSYISNYTISKSDLYLTIAGTIGDVGEVPDKYDMMSLTENAAKLTNIICNRKYLMYSLLSSHAQEHFSSKFHQVAQPKLSIETASSTLVPIPPIEEQIRVVTKIEELLSIIELLDESKLNLEQAILQAKSKILDLAIHGTLVPQNPTDEPASELLKRINPKAAISCDNPHYEQVPFEIPDNWVWVRIGDVTNYGKCSSYSVDGIGKDSWVLELEDIEKDTGKVLTRHTKSEREIKGVRHYFSAGNVLYSKLRTYLNKVLWANEAGFCTTEIIPIECTDAVYSRYLCHVLRSKYFLDYTAQCGYGVKMPRLSTTDARKALIPLPPYEEQKKITRKLSELLNALDTIAETLV